MNLENENQLIRYYQYLSVFANADNIAKNVNYSFYTDFANKEINDEMLLI